MLKKVPKSAFINVKDFAGPKQLAEYLLYLDSNQTAYNSYFKWKKHVNFLDQLVFTPLCDMCIKLHLEDFFGIETKIINDIGYFWDKNSQCKIPKFDLNKNFLF